MGTRKPNGSPSIYQDENGYWHGRVTVGVRDNGRLDRRHVGGKNRAEVLRRINGSIRAHIRSVSTVLVDIQRQSRKNHAQLVRHALVLQ